VEGTIVGGLSRTGSGANVLGDPRIALTWLVNEISALGLSIEPGEVVTTGTCMQPIALQRGDHVRADFGPLGSVEARFA
jgi:2-keto-4-pentenoate hydratase